MGERHNLIHDHGSPRQMPLLWSCVTVMHTARDVCGLPKRDIVPPAFNRSQKCRPEEAMGAELRWPPSPGAIAQIQRERKRQSHQKALRAPFFRQRLAGLRPRPARRPGCVGENSAADQGSAARRSRPSGFHDEFCVAPRPTVVEYWRSGGVDRPAAVLSALGATTWNMRIMCFRRAFDGDRRDARTTSCTSRFRSASIRWRILCARRRGSRHRHGLVRLRHQHAVADCSSSSSAT